MQQFMPLALSGLMDGNVRLSLMRLNWMFCSICGKFWDLANLPTLKEDVVTTLNGSCMGHYLMWWHTQHFMWLKSWTSMGKCIVVGCTP
jgi:hypothetical protein